MQKLHQIFVHSVGLYFFAKKNWARNEKILAKMLAVDHSNAKILSNIALH